MTTMARLSQPPKGKLITHMAERDKRRKALDFLREHPDEMPIIASRIYKVAKPDTVKKAWQREKAKMARTVAIKHGGQNIKLRPTYLPLLRVRGSYCLSN